MQPPVAPIARKPMRDVGHLVALRQNQPVVLDLVPESANFLIGRVGGTLMGFARARHIATMGDTATNIGMFGGWTVGDWLDIRRFFKIEQSNT